MLSLLVCLAFMFYHMLTFIRYIEVYFIFVLVDCVRYNEDFIKSRLCSIKLRFNCIQNLVPHDTSLIM